MEQLASGGQPEILCPQKLILMHKIYGLQHTVSKIWRTAVLEESMGGGGDSFVSGFCQSIPWVLWRAPGQLCELLEGVLW